MKTGLSNAERVQKLPWALAGDTANIVHFYLALSGTILLLFLDKLGLDKKQIGVVISIFPFIDILALFVLPWAARVGYKRVFLWFWGGRKVILASLIAAPWIKAHYGTQVTFIFAITIIVLFSICRSTAVSAQSSWSHEFIPATIRGKYTAVQSILTVLAGTATTAAVGWMLASDAPLTRFQILFTIAAFFGFASTLFYSRVPDGEPQPNLEKEHGRWGQILSASKDRRLWTFEIGTMWVTFGWLAMASFLPLFYRQQANLKANQIFFLDSIYLAAGLLSCFLWGWAADRYGGKPVMILNLMLMSIYPIGLLLLPLNSNLTFTLAVILIFVVGLVTPGWTIGYGRYFYVNLVPQENRTGYIAIHSAIVGLSSGIVPLATGAVLDLDSVKNLMGTLGPIHIHAWTPLFFVCLSGLGLGVWTLSRMPVSGGIETSRFVSMFFQGSPLTALQAMIAYHQFTGQEPQRVATIERLGQSRSPFSVNELVEGLRDPSFNVRYEAVISIARTAPHHRLTESLIEVMEGTDTDLSLMAAWGLGRMGDPAAINSLRKALDGNSRLLRARAARALAMLRDQDSGPRIFQLFRDEQDIHARLSFAAALGSLDRTEALPDLLAFLRGLEIERYRREAALAVATILGDDERAVRLWRRMTEDPGDALAGVVLGLRRQLSRLVSNAQTHNPTLEHVIVRTANYFGNGDMQRGVSELRVLAGAVENGVFRSAVKIVLADAVDAIDQFGETRMEYVILAVHCMHIGVEESA
ncbi:MAG: MFS transporter [Phycisphaeraceae bacterium]|nr:MFS transporter [Phycisphaeraceae bacterium]